MSFQKRAEPQCEKVGLALVSNDKTEPVTTINCGWRYRHKRKKVREDAAQRHLDKHHGGQGIWW